MFFYVELMAVQHACTCDVNDTREKSDVVFYCTRVYTAQYRYDPTTRPVKDDNTTITANVAISLYHILDMVSRAGPRCMQVLV